MSCYLWSIKSLTKLLIFKYQFEYSRTEKRIFIEIIFQKDSVLNLFGLKKESNPFTKCVYNLYSLYKRNSLQKKIIILEI